MKILRIGLDNSILDKNSSLAQRAIEYGKLVKKYTIIIPINNFELKITNLNLSDRVSVDGVKTSNKIFTLYKIYKLAKQKLKLDKYDVITIQDTYYLALIGFIFSRKFKIGLELQIHGFEKYSGLRKIIAKFVIPRANAIRCVSQRLRKRLVSAFGVEEKKITVVPIYINTNSYKYKTNSHEYALDGLKQNKESKLIFLTVGRLVPVKNIEMQIRAFKNLVPTIPLAYREHDSHVVNLRTTNNKNIELWIVGDGPEREKLELLIKDLGLENKVKLLGWQKDVNKFLLQADIFLLTSNYEGWGLVVIEASSFGLPIIMTDVGCAGEVIKNNESGLIIDVGNQEALENSMIKLIENKELRKKLGENARQALKKLPNKEETFKLYESSLKQAMENYNK